jgi:hypothetical protein
MEDLTSKTVAVFARPFTVPSFNETLPAGAYEIETELVSPPDQKDPAAWKASVLVKLHPRISHPGLSRTLTVSLADLDNVRAKDKLTGKPLSDFFLEEMLADPMVRLVMEADGVSEAHLRHLYSGPRTPQSDGGCAGLEAGASKSTRKCVNPGCRKRRHALATGNVAALADVPRSRTDMTAIKAMAEVTAPGNAPNKRALGDKPRERPCLRCDVVFWSDGFGERICRRCKGLNAWRNAVPVSPGASRRR